jgi:hypothetical protein
MMGRIKPETLRLEVLGSVELREWIMYTLSMLSAETSIASPFHEYRPVRSGAV